LAWQDPWMLSKILIQSLLWVTIIFSYQLQVSFISFRGKPMLWWTDIYTCFDPYISLPVRNILTSLLPRRHSLVNFSTQWNPRPGWNPEIKHTKGSKRHLESSTSTERSSPDLDQRGCSLISMQAIECAALKGNQNPRQTCTC